MLQANLQYLRVGLNHCPQSLKLPSNRVQNQDKIVPQIAGTSQKPHPTTLELKLEPIQKNIFHKNREISILMMKKKQQG
jgi:hypothetical protein